MTDRPIIFSGPMVRALLEGRKTQTRRLATSPLRKAVPGDRLWVREAFAEVAEGYLCITRADYPACVPRHFENVPPIHEVKWQPSIHMPRNRSRLTLVVTDARVEQLQAISRDDAIAEGLRFRQGVLEQWWHLPEPYEGHNWLSPVAAYEFLWTQLHGRESWDANPLVVALTFTVERVSA